MADITLADVVAWEPRLQPLDPVEMAEWGEREITWTVSARASSPMLPSIRGGELVLLPRRAVTDAGVALPILLRELASHGTGAVVLDQDPAQPAPLPILIVDPIPADFESDLNRMLTERRGELYRAGTDLGRLLANAAAAGSDLSHILSITGAFLHVPVAVLDRRGATLAATGDQTFPGGRASALGEPAHGWSDDRFGTRLAGGETLWIGPAPDVQRALVRLAAERIALAAEGAIQRASEARPRGPARAAALTELLTGASQDPRRAASLLGLPVDGVFRVALASPEVDSHTLQRLLGPQGVIHQAAPIDGAAAAVIETPADAINALSGRATGRAGAVRRREQAAVPHGWIALSGAANGVASLPNAANEARFVAALLAAGLIAAHVARFDALSDVGPYRLLHRFWGSTELDLFAQDALGDLPARDKRGTLRRTLLAYLATGGAQVDAAAKLEIHRNTLAYRLRQIADLTGRDPSDPSTWLVLHLALLASSLPPAPSALTPNP